MNKIPMAVIGLVVLTGMAYAAEPGGRNRVVNVFPNGSVNTEAGLSSWQKFYEVASHPRCANCHVGSANRPM